jgi:type I restriction enzyme S subunit
MRDKIQLSKVADLIMGQSPDSSFCNQIEEGLPFLQGCGEFGKKYPIVENYCTQPKKISPKKSILISVRAPVGDINIADKDFVIGRGLAGIVAKNVDNDFLFYSILNFKRQLKRVSQGSTFEAINSKELQEFEINCFPLPQQRKIAQILTTCDAVIEKTAAAIAKYQAMKQGLMHDLFTRGIDVNTGKLRPKQEDAPQLYKESELGWIPKEWEVKPISEIGEVISGGTPSSTVTEFWNGDIVWITPSDLSKLKKVVIDDSERKITTKGLISSSALLIKKDSIILSSRAPIGYCAVVSTEFTTNQGCKSISFKENHNVYYHYYNLMLNISRVKLKGEGTTFAEISKKELEKINLSFPDNVKEQEMIALRMKAIEDDIQTEQSALSKYQQLKTGLMQDLLSGKVEVKV